MLNPYVSAAKSGGRLAAVLLNPPASTTGVRTRNAVHRAASVLGYSDVEIVNLCLHPTQSVVELNDYDGDSWLDAREELTRALAVSSGWLAAWGLAGLTGRARKARAEQVAWLIKESRRLELVNVWMLGGEPRHPSRWHQYLSDKYGRTGGGSALQRLSESLVSVQLIDEPGGPSAEATSRTTKRL